jgi:hypothetical protein
MNTASLFISNLESNDFGSYSIRISNIHGVCWRKLIIYDSGLYICTSRHDINEILLKVALSTISLSPEYS